MQADDSEEHAPTEATIADSEPPMRSKIGKYRVLAKLGQGGMAMVHLAAALGPSGFSKLLVLKTLRSSLAQDPQSVQMFLKEARLAARLNHPNVVQTYEVLQEAQMHLIVMEYLEGAPLSVLRRKLGRNSRPILPLAAHLAIIMDALAGLQHAHSLRDYTGSALEVVHRDVSSNNIFVTLDGVAKLLDFGIAKAANSQATNTGTIKGTVRYLAPETILNQGVDRRADIFAAGVLVWEAATGTRILDGLTDVAVMHRILTGDLPTARATNSDVPEELDAICRRAMAFERKDRYQTAEELREDLQKFLASRGELDTARAKIPLLVTECLGEELTKRRQRINAQLAKLEKAHEEHDSGSIPLVSLELSGTSSRDDVTLNAPSSRRKTVLKSLAIVAATAIAGGVFATVSPVGFVRSSTQATQQANANQTKATTTSQGAGSAEQAQDASDTSTIEVRLRAIPVNAVLYLGDERLAGNPVVLRRAKDGTESFFRAEAAGYSSGVINLRMDNNIDVMLVLTQAPVGELGDGGAAPRRARRTTSRASTANASRQEDQRPTSADPMQPPSASQRQLDTDNPWGQ